MIERTLHLQEVKRLLKSNPIVALIGARQVGKTTLAKTLASQYQQQTTFFDLEDPRDLARLADPMLVLSNLSGLIILDEVQRKPELFPILRVLADRPGHPAKFLVLGSAAPELLQQSSESLAGRIIFYCIEGLNLSEVGIQKLDQLWERGGFPRSFTAPSNQISYEWREAFIQTFLERDLPQLGIKTSSTTMQRFWSMLANYHGQIWNSSEFARSFGVSDNSIRRYLDVLSSTFVVRQLLPWHENLSKRQVKAPKVYIEDSGLLHALLGLETKQQIEKHPKVGASWEGFCLEMVISQLNAQPRECFFWATHSGAELDLLVIKGGVRRGFEFKLTSAPSVTRSMQIAMDDLQLDSLDVLHAGEHTFLLSKKIRAVSMSRILQDIHWPETI